MLRLLVCCVCGLRVRVIVGSVLCILTCCVVLCFVGSVHAWSCGGSML